MKYVNNIYKLMAKKGMTKEVLLKKAGITEQYYYYLLNAYPLILTTNNVNILAEL